MQGKIAISLGCVSLVVACSARTPPPSVSSSEPPQQPVIVIPPSPSEPAPIAVAPPVASTGTTPPAEPDETAPPSTGSCDGLKLEIKAVKNQGYTQFTGTLTNGGKKTVTLIEPGDGSDVGWRTPILTWKATTASGQPAAPRQVGRCGNVNPLSDKEVFTLKPGEKKALGGWLGEPYVQPGRYSVRLVYENDPRHGLKGLPLGDPSVPKAFRTSTPCKVESAPITVDL